MTTTSVREIVLGVTGSIAAYKACEIASLLVKRRVRVTPVLTWSAQKLVGPASFEAITGNQAITEMFTSGQNKEIEHIAVARRADLFLIAPATAHILAKAAHGLADDWLSTTLLATRAPVVFAPAMNTNMYEHPATQANIATLAGRSCRFVGPDSGTLACKTDGLGRLADPSRVVEEAMVLLEEGGDLDGKRVLLTSGRNHEPIDPVRYIGNRSSGKMGYAVAEEALRRGAKVTVVSGPAEVAPPVGCEVVSVQTAQEMCDAVLSLSPSADVVIGVAAVADYRVEHPMAEKHKRNGDELTLKLTQNPDILAAVGAQKKSGQVTVGFAAETSELIENARGKLSKKNLDLVVANEVGVSDSGFETDTVRAAFVACDGAVDEQPFQSKRDLAHSLFDRVAALLP
ncbi:MAG: bifunctional phosphopantothenoylcysteine decarboxylase/phosphopantothenate--cysteine ligase CoaBC [Candidatus Hydrogenedentes bacterium]|nr:bifunctional phosphopantothenoylcysteine decarboxylase/phosphopantothenate--cysteine ligase CoaBC [Candidatus Hydrogenedentota bacterium]